MISGSKPVNFPLSAFGDLRTVELSPVFQGSFEYTVDNTELTVNAANGSGTIAQADAMAVVSTGTTTGSDARLMSKRLAKYKAGLGSLTRFTTLFTLGVSGTEQLVGLLDDSGSSVSFENGFAVGYIGDTFGFHRFVNDSLISVPKIDWKDPLNGSGPSGETLDPTKLNVWFINFQYLGAGAIHLMWEKPSGELVTVFTVEYANTYTVPSTYNPNFHFTIWSNNGATTSDIVVKSASYGFFVEGKAAHMHTQQPQFPSGLQQKTGVTTETVIFNLRCKAEYAGKKNFIEILLEAIGGSLEANAANNLGNIRLYKNATITSPVWSDIDTTDSVAEIDTSGTFSGGKLLLTNPLAGKNDKIITKVVEFAILLLHGETLTITGESANNATINAGCLWRELF